MKDVDLWAIVKHVEDDQNQMLDGIWMEND